MVTFSFDSKIFVIKILESIDYLFKFSLKSFCILCMTNDLQFKSGHFEYCHEILHLLQIFCCSRHLLILLWQKKVGTHLYCHVEVKVQVPPLASSVIASAGRGRRALLPLDGVLKWASTGSTFSLDGCESPGSPLCLL